MVAHKIFESYIIFIFKMRKFILDLKVVSSEHLNAKNVLLKLTHDERLPEMLPGQFVEVKVANSSSTYLRRPISINFVDEKRNELWLLVAKVGDGTSALGKLKEGDTLNCVLPLGNTFKIPNNAEDNILLIGGGVGVAPLLYLGKEIHDRGGKVSFLLGGRTSSDMVELETFQCYGTVYVTTEDGTMGEKGFVTDHSILQQETFTQISTCGPKPMMVAVARYAKSHSIYCEASLENLMACGVGACLCCVEKTVDGNQCTCVEGPVFDVNRLLW